MNLDSVATQTENSALKHRVKKRSIVLQLPDSASNEDEQLKVVIKCCEFEVFGIVQDVSFRHYTLRRAQKLGVRGWCMNSNNGTILGLIQGYPRSFESMRLWLTYTGSPTSRIDKCVFGPTTDLVDFSFDEFTIRM